MKKSLVIFIVVFLVLALATLAFAAKPDIFDKGTGLDISPTFSYTSTVETGDKSTGLDISPSSSYTSTVDKADKGTGLDKKQEKDFDKSNGVFSNSSYDNGGYKRTNYTTSVTLDSTYSWEGTWDCEKFVSDSSDPNYFWVYFFMDLTASKSQVNGTYGTGSLSGSLKGRIDKNGKLVGRWKEYDSYYGTRESGWFEFTMLEGGNFIGEWGYKKNVTVGGWGGVPD